MKLFIIAVGHKMPDWINQGYLEYIKRLPREIDAHLIEIRPEKRTNGKTTEQMLKAECHRIRSAMPAGCRMIVLDESGQQWTSADFAGKVQKWMAEGDPVAFIIGSADGLHSDIKQCADKQLALSRLTLPHGMARMVLAEQLYRVCSIIKGHPYHRI